MIDNDKEMVTLTTRSSWIRLDNSSCRYVGLPDTVANRWRTKWTRTLPWLMRRSPKTASGNGTMRNWRHTRVYESSWRGCGRQDNSATSRSDAVQDPQGPRPLVGNPGFMEEQAARFLYTGAVGTNGSDVTYVGSLRHKQSTWTSFHTVGSHSNTFLTMCCHPNTICHFERWQLCSLGAVQSEASRPNHHFVSAGEVREIQVHMTSRQNTFAPEKNPTNIALTNPWVKVVLVFNFWTGGDL